MPLNGDRMQQAVFSEPEDATKVGIMADSHGDAGLIAAAADYLREQGCRRLFHLGDVCDTARPQSAAACLQQLAAHRIAPIRGNNEHTLLLDRPASVAAETLAAIAAMPLARRMGATRLVHSVPYTDALGARCMIEALTANHIRAYFSHFPGEMLFRGHSHHPEIVRAQTAAWSREAMTVGKTYRLAPGEGAVVTCGALTEGLALVWDPRHNTVTPAAVAGCDR